MHFALPIHYIAMETWYSISSSNIYWKIVLLSHVNWEFQHSNTLTLSHLHTLSDASAEDDFWKHCDKGRNCSKRAISPFSHNVFNFLPVIKPTIIAIFHICLIVTFNFSRLLQICCLWERVKIHLQQHCGESSWGALPQCFQLFFDISPLKYRDLLSKSSAAGLSYLWKC